MKRKTTVLLITIILICGSILIGSSTVGKDNEPDTVDPCPCGNQDITTEPVEIRGFLYAMNPIWCQCDIFSGLNEEQSINSDLICYLGNIDVDTILLFNGRYVEVTGYWYDCILCMKLMVDTIGIAPLCGDTNSDGMITVSDAVFLVNYIFDPGCPAPDPLCIADINEDRGIDISDVITIINYLFVPGSPPPDSNCCNQPAGNFIDMTDCKIFERDETPPDQDCIEWNYDGTGTLLLKHVNAGFNCCPEIETGITIVDNLITIEEIEILGECDCLCLFDINYSIVELPPGTYTIHVDEPYVPEGEEVLEFTVDLSATTSGSYCVERTFYPWGI